MATSDDIGANPSPSPRDSNRPREGEENITERRNVETELAAANEELWQERSMFTAGPVVVFKWRNEEGWPVEYVSTNVEAILGYAAEEFLSGKVSYAEIIPAEDLQRVAEEVAKYSAHGVAWFHHHPYRITRKDQTIIWLADYTTILRDSEGQITHYLGYVIDITERINAEEERQQLESRVWQAQKLESLGILAGGIAHDFNNLLMAILGNADLAGRELPKDSTARSFIEDVQSASQRAAELCRQLLAYSGRGHFIKEVLDVNRLLEEMTHLLAVSISKKVNLKFDLSKGVPAIDADGTQIRQVIMNLITNAAEAMGEGAGSITIRTGMVECSEDELKGTSFGEAASPGSFVFLEVIDTGEGMDKQVLSRIFDPFFSTKFTGRGLGLAAVLGIIRGHGGALDVASTVGEGTNFRLLFPAISEDAPLREPEPVKPWRGSGTVLVVDDEEGARDVAGKMLRATGCDVITARDGVEAIEIFRKRDREIDLILLDLSMPRLDGRETLEILREIRTDVRVLLSSGYTEQDVVEETKGNEAVQFIQKPYSLTQLTEKVRLALGE